MFLVYLQLLIILCTIGYKRFFYDKYLYILSIYIFLCMICHMFYTNYIFTLSLYVLYIVLILIFSYIRLKSILLVSFFYLIQNSLIMITWILTYYIPSLFLISAFVSLPFLYIIQISLLFILIFIINFVDRYYNLWSQISKYNKRWTGGDIIILIISNVFLTFGYQAMTRKGSISIHIYISFLLFVGVALITLISIFIIKNHSNKIFINQIDSKSRENSKFILLANEFQHDFKTFLYTTKRYSELKDLAGLNNYLNSLENYSFEMINHSLLDQIYNLKDPAIQGLLLNCIEKCHNNKIKLSLDIQDYPHQDFFFTIDFARVLSILINNAIEHSSGKVYINFSNFGGISSCVVRNTSDIPLEINKIFERNFSTKKKHQGIGLSILKKIVKSYNNVDLIVENINNWVSFTVTSSE